MLCLLGKKNQVKNLTWKFIAFIKFGDKKKVEEMVQDEIEGGKVPILDEEEIVKKQRCTTK